MGAKHGKRGKEVEALLSRQKSLRMRQSVHSLCRLCRFFAKGSDFATLLGALLLLTRRGRQILYEVKWKGLDDAKQTLASMMPQLRSASK